MQMEKAEQIRKVWGDKPCNHPNIEKEYYLGSQTDDYVCTQCGKTFTKEQYRELNLD
jgi:transposase-like protein